ncbi:MAG TPA: AzlD domain-containing protein [Thermosynergistes sp.]|nr:AzlD domain-containing protein [Thermosynergistes sp.]
MKVWLVLFLGGILTYLTRLSFIYLFDLWEIPLWLRKSLRYVPPAVLSALIAPELFIRSGQFLISFENMKLLAGVVAIVTAIFTKSMFWTISSGIIFMLTYSILM